MKKHFKLENITIGSDLEMFIKNSETDELASAVGVFGGTKKEPKYIGELCYIQEDNILVEANIPPVTNFPDFYKYISYIKNYINTNYPQFTLHYSSSEIAPLNLLLNGKAREFGCDPVLIVDYNNNGDVIPDDEFDQFSPSLTFGNLHLHYIFIGRHFLEMFDAKDMVCPQKHFRAQHEFNATCGMVFSEPQDEVLHNTEMQIYYHQRGGKQFFGFDYEDQKLAKGFFKLGQLQDMTEYAQPQRREALRQQLKKSQVVG